MKRTDNYAIQAQRAKAHFLTYDQTALIRKFRLDADAGYLYPVMLGCTYRLCRETGDLQRLAGETWVDANTYNEIMTLLDLLCDAREDRKLAGRWKTMQHFGQMFHRSLLEEDRDPQAEYYDQNEAAFHRGCRALGGRPFPGADAGYAVPLFDGLEIALQLWHADEDFGPRLRFLWDENALSYIRYETMYFAVGLLLRRLRETGD